MSLLSTKAKHFKLLFTVVSNCCLSLEWKYHGPYKNYQGFSNVSLLTIESNSIQLHMYCACNSALMWNFYRLSILYFRWMKSVSRPIVGYLWREAYFIIFSRILCSNTYLNHALYSCKGLGWYYPPTIVLRFPPTITWHSLFLVM